MTGSEVCGMPLENISEQVVPLGALVILKVLDDDGDVAYMIRSTDGVSLVESLGMASFANVCIKNILQRRQNGDD